MKSLSLIVEIDKSSGFFFFFHQLDRVSDGTKTDILWLFAFLLNSEGNQIVLGMAIENYLVDFLRSLKYRLGIFVQLRVYLYCGLCTHVIRRHLPCWFPETSQISPGRLCPALCLSLLWLWHPYHPDPLFSEKNYIWSQKFLE